MNCFKVCVLVPTFIFRPPWSLLFSVSLVEKSALIFFRLQHRVIVCLSWLYHQLWDRSTSIHQFYKTFDPTTKMLSTEELQVEFAREKKSKWNTIKELASQLGNSIKELATTTIHYKNHSYYSGRRRPWTQKLERRFVSTIYFLGVIYINKIDHFFYFANSETWKL